MRPLSLNPPLEVSLGLMAAPDVEVAVADDERPVLFGLGAREVLVSVT
jgi:hypothetical protein